MSRMACCRAARWPASPSPIEMMTITDSILATEEVKRRNIRQLTIAPLLAEAMRRISDESSVSSLFD
jgi:ribose-phosphate pyrophosphokinase